MKNLTEIIAEKLKSKGRIEKRYHQDSNGNILLYCTLEIGVEAKTCKQAEKLLEKFFIDSVSELVGNAIEFIEEEGISVERIVERPKESKSTKSYKELCKDASQLLANKEYEQAKAVYTMALSSKSSNYKEAEEGIILCEKWIKAINAINQPLVGRFGESIEDQATIAHAIKTIEEEDKLLEKEEDQDSFVDFSIEKEITNEIAPAPFAKLLPHEEAEYRQHARNNYKVGDEIKSIWHPVYQEECKKIEEEYLVKMLDQVSPPSALESNLEEFENDDDEFLPPPFEV